MLSPGISRKPDFFVGSMGLMRHKGINCGYHKDNLFWKREGQELEKNERETFYGCEMWCQSSFQELAFRSSCVCWLKLVTLDLSCAEGKRTLTVPAQIGLVLPLAESGNFPLRRRSTC